MNIPKKNKDIIFYVIVFFFFTPQKINILQLTFCITYASANIPSPSSLSSSKIHTVNNKK